jgi:hypothetical protein
MQSLHLYKIGRLDDASLTPAISGLTRCASYVQHLQSAERPLLLLIQHLCGFLWAGFLCQRNVVQKQTPPHRLTALTVSMCGIGDASMLAVARLTRLQVE